MIAIFQSLRCEVVRARHILLKQTEELLHCVATETEQAGSRLVPQKSLGSWRYVLLYSTGSWPS